MALHLDPRRRIARLRLRAQRLVGPPVASPAEAVRWMLGLQGQDYPGVKWSVGLRSPGSSAADVEAAFDAGAIVRSWPLRGTLHLVAAEDLPWLLDLTTARAIASAAKRRETLGITEADIERARELAVAALPGRTSLPRAELLAAIEAGGVSTAGQRGYHLLWYLAQTGTLVLGPTTGNGSAVAGNGSAVAGNGSASAGPGNGPISAGASEQSFARLEAWIPNPRHLDRDEALGELAARYFASHGPADAGDLARWAGLTLGEVRRGIDVAGDRIGQLQIGGQRLLAAPGADDLAAAPAPAGLLLLPGFDEYILGYRDRSAMLAAEHAETIVPGGNGMFRSTMVLDGEVVGTWGRRTAAAGITIEPEPFDDLAPDALDALGAVAKAYGRFLGRPVRASGRGWGEAPIVPSPAGTG